MAMQNLGLVVFDYISHRKLVVLGLMLPTKPEVISIVSEELETRKVTLS